MNLRCLQSHLNSSFAVDDSVAPAIEVPLPAPSDIPDGEHQYPVPFGRFSNDLSILHYARSQNNPPDPWNWHTEYFVPKGARYLHAPNPEDVHITSSPSSLLEALYNTASAIVPDLSYKRLRKTYIAQAVVDWIPNWSRDAASLGAGLTLGILSLAIAREAGGEAWREAKILNERFKKGLYNRRKRKNVSSSPSTSSSSESLESVPGNNTKGGKGKPKGPPGGKKGGGKKGGQKKGSSKGAK